MTWANSLPDRSGVAKVKCRSAGLLSALPRRKHWLSRAGRIRCPVALPGLAQRQNLSVQCDRLFVQADNGFLRIVRRCVQAVRAVLRAGWCFGFGNWPAESALHALPIAEFIPLTPQAIRKVGHRYAEGGLERALYEKDREPLLCWRTARSSIIAMVCAALPEGHARWTVRWWQSKP